MIKLYSKEEYDAIKKRADEIKKATTCSDEDKIELEILKQLLYNYKCRSKVIGSQSIDLKKLKDELSGCKDNLAFIFGNGINRYAWNDAGDKSDISWDGMLLHLWKDVCNEDFLICDYKNNPKIPDEGVTYTEFFNILESFLQNQNHSLPKHKRVGLKKRTKDYVMKHINEVKDYHRKLQKLLEKSFNCPVMTTNYDYNIGEGWDFDPEYKDAKWYTNNFLMESYRAKPTVKNPFNEFSVWHINGSLKFAQSLRIGLSDYTSIISQATERIKNWRDSTKSGSPNMNIGFYKSWLRMFFEKDLCIVGLSLDTNEVLLRWLLIERKKYLDTHPDVKVKTWYVARKGDVDVGMDFYLDFLDVELVALKDYKEVYEGIFK